MLYMDHTYSTLCSSYRISGNFCPSEIFGLEHKYENYKYEIMFVRYNSSLLSCMEESLKQQPSMYFKYMWSDSCRITIINTHLVLLRIFLLGLALTGGKLLLSCQMHSDRELMARVKGIYSSNGKAQDQTRVSKWNCNTLGYR